MTKMIEHVLGLPSMEDILRSTEPTVEQDDYEEQNEKELEAILAITEKAEKGLEIIDSGQTDHNNSMDEIHKKTLKHADELMELGYNVDQRSAATIFEKANMLYKTALDAKDSKRKAQLNTMKLLLDQKKLELEEKRLNNEMGSGPIIGDAIIVDDRNALIKLMREKREKN